MQLNVTIESSPFEKVLEEGISALGKEELKDIIKQVIYEAFANCEGFKDLLVYREKYYSGGLGEPQLGELAKEAIRSLDMSEEVAELKKKMVAALMENHQKIVENMLLRCFIDTITRDSDFQNALRYAAQNVYFDLQNPRQ